MGSSEPPSLTPEQPDAKEVVREFTRQLERIEAFKVMRDERRAADDLSEPDNDPLLATMRMVNLIAGRLLLVERGLERALAVEKAIGGPDAVAAAFRRDIERAAVGRYAANPLAHSAHVKRLWETYPAKSPEDAADAAEGRIFNAVISKHAYELQRADAQAKLGLNAERAIATDATQPVLDPDALFDRAFGMLQGMRKLDDSDDAYKPAFTDIELMVLSKRLNQSSNMIVDGEGKSRPMGMLVREAADLAEFVQRIGRMLGAHRARILGELYTREDIVDRIEELHAEHGFTRTEPG